jgi:transposase-like protein
VQLVNEPLFMNVARSLIGCHSEEDRGGYSYRSLDGECTVGCPDEVNIMSLVDGAAVATAARSHVSIIGLTGGGEDPRKMHANKRQERYKALSARPKVSVMGMLDRDSQQVRAKFVPNVKRETLQNAILDQIQKRSTVYTDGSPAYDNLVAREYVHETVNHVEEYVRGQIHTQGIENFWALMKPGLRGTYIAGGSNLPPADYPFTITASANNAADSANATLRVSGFSAALDKTSASLGSGQSAIFNVILTSLNHFTSSNISLSCGRSKRKWHHHQPIFHAE